MKMKSLKTQFIGAIAMVLVAAIAMGSSTYAWFAMNTNVTATGMQVKVKSNSTFLLIGEESLADADAIQGQTGADLTTEALTVADNDADLYPAKAYLQDAKDATATTLTSATKVDDKATAADAGNWYTANSNDATVWGGTGVTQNAAELTAFTDYVIKKTVKLTLADGSTKANELTVTADIDGKDTYNKTTDIVLDNTKTYYTESAGVYTVVGTPDLADIATYYEKATDYSAVKVLVVSDNDVVAVLDKDHTTANLYNGTSTNNLDITSTTVHVVDIYIYYDGTETAVRTNNAVNLSGATIELSFSVAVNE